MSFRCKQAGIIEDQSELWNYCKVEENNCIYYINNIKIIKKGRYNGKIYFR